MADPISNRKSQLSAAKRALLAQRLKGKAKTATPAIPRRPADAVVPLSFSQQRLWFLYQFAPDNPFYNVPFGLRLRGKLDLNALNQVLQTLIQRHEILRTTFVDADQTNEGETSSSGQPQQIVHPKGLTTLQQIDLSGLGAQVWPEVERQAHIESHKPFNLYEGPLLRVTLLTVAADDFVLLMTLHHIISDVWSTGVLVKEMAMLYHAFTQVLPNPLPPLPIQYGDFTLWQRQRLRGDYLQKQINYWKQQFATLPPVLQLPTDRPRPAVQSFRGDSQNFTLSAELTTGLKQLGQATDATLFMTVLAAFKVLLYRYTGQTDITVGSPIANRNQAAIEGLVGLFMNTLALRTQLDGNPSFRDVLLRVRETALGAYSHQDLPFEKLIDTLSLPRELSHTPLFQVMVVLQNAPNSGLQLPNLTLDPLELPRTTAKLDLTITLMEVAPGMHGSIEYNTDLFDGTTIERLLGHFQVLLTEIVTTPDACLGELPLLSPNEVKQLEQWRQTDNLEVSPTCLHQHFEAQVEKHPDAISLTFEQDHLTYGELNQQANQIAHYLRELGVGPDKLVGLCVERSPDMVVGILGILKAGGAYVPLDPAYPTARLKFMFQDADISVLVTQSSLLQDIPDSPVPVVTLDGDRAKITQAATTNPDARVTAGNLAYIIYTSGSTGTPKGVMIPHHNVVRLFKAADRLYHFDHQDCWTLFHSYAFDFSVWELWGALLYGGRLVIVPYWISRSPQEFYQLLVDQRVTVLNQTPSAFNQVIQIDAHQSANSLSLRYVIFGGEALAIESLRPWFERHGDTQPQLVNMYGITETTVHVTHRPLTVTDLDRASSPIGQPLADLQCTILDPYLQPVPIGVPGELHVGGAGLARGYLNRPELTAERFIDHPFSQGRLYKTGDLVKYLPDGTLDYLGRIDHQVKIRGFRIELGEIEALLQQHPQVRETLVMVRPESSGQDRLVAYLSAVSPDRRGTTAPCSVAELRQWLQEKLPDYMVPSAFVWLAQMPLNANGKVDRAQLQALPVESLGEAIGTPFVAPRSPIEQQLANIWTQVLGQDAIGIDDNFFELGGDSILSLQIITQTNQAGLQLTLKQLFQHQTIRSVATVVKPIRVTLAEQGPVSGPVALTPSQQQWLAQEVPPSSIEWMCTALPQPLTLDGLRHIVHHLLGHHDGLRSRFWQQGTTWQQEILPPVALESLLPDVVTEIEADVADAISTIQPHIDLAETPLFRAVLINPPIASAPQHLLLIAHALIIDQGSWAILLDDVQTLIEQQTQPLQLSAKTTSVQQWAKHLQDQSQTIPSDRWSITQPQSSIPRDVPSEKQALEECRTITLSLSTTETQSLLQQVPPAYRTHTHEVLLTALSLTYNDWARASQLTVDVAVNHRTHAFKEIDLSRTVGLFISFCPMALALTDCQSLGAALKTIKEQLRPQWNQVLDYEIWRYLTLEPSGSNVDMPTVDISFRYHEPGKNPYLGVAPSSVFASSGALERLDNGHKLHIDGRIIDQQLQVSWTYRPNQYRTTTVKALAETYLQKIRALIDHCLSPEAGGYTPSDFPLAKLDQTTLDQLVVHYPQLEDCYPLTPIQQGFLFHTLYAPEEALYMNQLQCRLRGNLDTEALRETWQRVSDRHPILRTAFAWENLEQPLQIVHRQVTVPWQLYDWRAKSSEEQKTAFKTLLQQDLSTGLPSHVAPLMRITLIRVADDCYDIIWGCHHMLLDGWSMPMVIQEIFSLYEGLAQGSIPVLEDRRPYRDYISWLSCQDLVAAEKFWTSLLQGFHAPTPLGYRPSPGAAPNHKIQGLTLNPKTATALQTLARRQYLTLNTVLQGAWALLLNHISGGQPDIVFGATTAGRPPSIHGAEKMVGLFINTLPVRVTITSDLDIMTWLQAIQTQQSEARQYEYSPLNQIQRWSDVPNGSSLFESLVVCENYRVAPAEHPSQENLEIESVDIVQNNNYPLTLRVLPRENVTLEIMSDRTCFAAEVTDRWLHHLDALLQWLVDNPDATLGDWQAQLTELERQWQKQQAQTQAKSNLKKLRKTRRKVVHSGQEDS